MDRSNPLIAVSLSPSVLVFLVSILPKIVFGLFFIADIHLVLYDPDSWGYFHLAENLRKEGVFSQSEFPPYHPDNIRTPVYPLFLASLLTISGGSLWIIPIAQGIINSLSSVLILKIGTRLFSQPVGLTAGLFFALDPSALIRTYCLLTESLFTFLFLSSIFLLIKSVYQQQTLIQWICAGILLGLTTLCRPLALYFFLPASILFWMTSRENRKSRLQKILIYTLGFSFTLMPWLIRNKLVFGVANLSAIQGINLLLVNAAHLKSAEDNIDSETATNLLQAEAESLFFTKNSAIYRSSPYLAGTSPNQAQLAQCYQKLALQKVFSSPLRYLSIHTRGLLFSLVDTNTRDFYFFHGLLHRNLGLRDLILTQGLLKVFPIFLSKIDTTYFLLFFFNLVWLLFHYAGMTKAAYDLFRQKWVLPLVWMLLPIAYLLILGVPAGFERFRFPAMPFLYVLSAFGLSRGLSKILERKRIKDEEKET